MKTIEQLIQDANNAIAELRERAEQPFSIKVSSNIDVEIRPLSEDERVTVGCKDLGHAIVNFTSEGLILDVYADANPLETLHTACVYRDEFTDMESSNDEVQGGNDLDYYAGYVNTQTERIDLEFSAPKGVSQKTLDATAFAALAMKAKVDYLRMN